MFNPKKIPLQPGAKAPLIKWEHATSDTQELQRLAERYPGCNWGALTGSEYDFWVLDVDNKNGVDGSAALKALEEIHGALPETRLHRTPSGGYHYFFRYRGDEIIKNSAGLVPGLDVRGERGMIVLPPSCTEEGAYTVISDAEMAVGPQWLVELVTRKPVKSSAPLTPNAKGFDEGTRNQEIFRHACRLRARNVALEQAREQILELAEQCRPPFPKDEALRCLESAYSRYAAGMAFPHTDSGNGERLAALHGGEIRYLVELDQWVVWQHPRWVIDQGDLLIERRAKDTARQVQVEAEAATDSKLKETIQRHGRKSEARPRICAMIGCARSEPEIPIALDALDADDWKLGVQNGYIDLKTGRFHPPDRSLLLTRSAGTNYVADAACPQFEAFLSRIMNEDVDKVRYLQRAFGYALTGSTREQALFILHGTGANGKSTLLRVMRALVGDYGATVAAETLMAARGKTGSGATPDLFQLRGRRAAITNETEDNQRFSESLIKQLTGGDPIFTRPLYRPPVEFVPRFKIFIAANHKPNIHGADHSIWRRIFLVPFDVTIPKEDQDPELFARLQAELPGILNWALAGCAQWQQQGLNPPRCVMEATKEYREDQDLIGRWIEDHCTEDPSEDTLTTTLYTSFEVWAKLNNEWPMSRKNFKKKLEERGLKEHRKADGRCTRGIKLRSSPTGLGLLVPSQAA